ncbi:MAG: hypothetical protein AAFW95_08330 [Cyanobacteria bacterium J06638_6]
MQSTYTPSSVQSANANQADTQTRSLSQRIRQLGGALLRFLAPDDSIQIRQRQHNGQAIWFVYDRYTDQHLEFTSEQEVMAWFRI